MLHLRRSWRRHKPPALSNPHTSTLPASAVLQRIDDWTKVIGEMVMEVSKDVFVADPSGEALSGALLDGGLPNQRPWKIPNSEANCSP